ncbi:MAG: hypothetical protein KDD69_10625 [Bdellovibrionales bacterium]|nr:hypothetical protein [Bdellovibrionales bacterium]
MRKYLTHGCCCLQLGEETLQPISALFRVQPNRLVLAPSILAARLLFLALKRLLESHRRNPDREESADEILAELVEKGCEHRSEFSPIHKVILDGEPYFSICTGAASIYISLEEAERLVGDFDHCLNELERSSASSPQLRD